MSQRINEIVALLTCLLTWIHSCWYFDKSPRRVLLFFGGAIVLGTISEVAAILMTGGYSYEGFRWYIGPVPLFIAIGWGSTFYFAYVFGRVFTSRWQSARFHLFFLGIAAGLIAMSIDLWYDPVATTLGWWNYAKPGPYFDVPTANFIGWLVFAGLFCPLFGWIDSRDWSWLKKSVVFLLLLPVVFAITAALSFPFI